MFQIEKSRNEFKNNLSTFFKADCGAFSFYSLFILVVFFFDETFTNGGAADVFIFYMRILFAFLFLLIN